MSRLLSRDEITTALADLPGFAPGHGSIASRIEVPTFAEAVRFVTLVADEAEAMDHHPDVDLRFRTVFVRLSTHSAGGVTHLDVELAHRITSLARKVGGRTTGLPPVVDVAIDTADATRIHDFWKVGLGYREQVAADGSRQLQDPDGRRPSVWFQPTDEGRTGRGRLHLDVTVPDHEALPRVAAALAAGGVLVTDAFAPAWWVLADADGNELCVCTRQEPASR